jgi:hypothetical protein
MRLLILSGMLSVYWIGLVYITRRSVMIKGLTFPCKSVRYKFKIPISLDVMQCSVQRRTFLLSECLCLHVHQYI